MSIYRLLLTVTLAMVLCHGCASAPAGNTNLTTSGTQPSSAEKAGDERAAARSNQPQEPRKNSLKWTTASEVDNFGFEIYRSTSEEGPFQRMTNDPLPGAGTTDEPQPYQWFDYGIEAGVEYFYYIESISMGGVRERFSPVIKAPAKD